MPRRPEIGNVQLYPNRPLNKRDKNGYMLKFYCPILQKRVRKNCGTRDRKEARRIQRECRERLLNGMYAESDGAITEAKAIELQPHFPPAADAETGMSWQVCYDRFREHRRIRMRAKSLDDVCSRIRLAERILQQHRRRLSLAEGLPMKQVCRLDVLEFLQERLLAGDECRYKSRSPNTVNSTMAGVMTFVRYCHKHGWIDAVPPVEKIESDEVMKGRPITESEFQRMLDATPEVVGQQAADSWRFALRILWESGLRVGDLMDLSWDQEDHIQPVWPSTPEQHPTLLIPSTQKNRRVQEIPLLPGLQALLESVPEGERRGWIVNPVALSPRLKRGALRPETKDLKLLAKAYSNVAIARMCGVSETAVRKWLDQARIADASRNAKLLSEVPLAIVRKLRELPAGPPPTSKSRLSKERVGEVISLIGEAAGVVVVTENVRQGRRTKYASAHDLRRGCAQRLINAGVSAETLTVVMRHGDFATTMKHYGAVRSAQAAASELQTRLKIESENRALVGGFVGGMEHSPDLTAEEVSKLKSLLKAL